MKQYRFLLPLFITTFIFLTVGNSYLAVTDPVESNYALTAKEMVLSGAPLSPRIYDTVWFDKPIFTYWVLYIAYTLFGFSDFATRLPFALCGALSVTVLAYYTRRRQNGIALSCLIAAIAATSLLFCAVTHSVLTDQYLLLFTEISLFSIYIGMNENSRLHTCIAYGAAACAVLTKGPVGIILPGLIILLYIVCEQKSVYLRRLFRPEGILLFFLLALPWYVYMYRLYGTAFIDGLLGFNTMTRALVSEHPQENVIYYYFLLLPVALLPWTGAAFYGMRRFFRKNGFPLFLAVWAFVPLLFYTVMATKYPTYTYISHIPFFYFAMLGVRCLCEANTRKIHFILTGPAIFYWLLFWLAALFIHVDYVRLNSLWPLFIFLPCAIVLTLFAQRMKAYIVLPVLVCFATATMYVLLTWQVLIPFYSYRSTVPLAANAASFGMYKVYFFEEFRTSFVYYTGIPALLVTPSGYDESKRLKRDPVWTQKHLFKEENEQTFSELVKAREKLLLIVPKSRLDDFKNSEFYENMTLQNIYGTFSIYVPRKDTI